jgi:hypothetical protein
MEHTMDAILSTQRRRLLLGLGGSAALALAGCGRPSAKAGVHFAGETMGTTYNVKVARWSPGGRLAEVQQAVQAAFDGVDRRMSLHRVDSELTRFNRGSGDMPLSDDLWRVVAAGQEIASATDGAFDMTVAPLVVRWGFGPAPRGSVPQGEEIRTIRARTGHRALRLDGARRLAAKGRADLELDLGGIAKGYGVDLAAAALDAAGASTTWSRPVARCARAASMPMASPGASASSSRTRCRSAHAWCCRCPAGRWRPRATIATTSRSTVAAIRTRSTRAPARRSITGSAR